MIIIKTDSSATIYFLKRVKSLRLLRTLFTVPLLIILVEATYFILIRPHLLASMATVPVELITAGILIISVVGALSALIVTLIITGIITVSKFNKENTNQWRARLKSQLSVLIISIILLGGFVIVTQKTAYTPPILDSEGKKLPNSIAVLEQVNLNNSMQWITIRGRNVNKPVLLFLAGGPGGSLGIFSTTISGKYW